MNEEKIMNKKHIYLRTTEKRARSFEKDDLEFEPRNWGNYEIWMA
jgi:hypothetical protein